EDDVLITESGYELLSKRLPRDPAAIEKIMAAASKERANGNSDMASGKSDDADRVRRQIARYTHSIDTCDTNVAAEVWRGSDEDSFIHPLGHEHGFAQIKEDIYQKLFGTVFSHRKLTVHDISVDVLGDAAVAEFYWDFAATLQKDGQPLATHGRETQVYTK